MSKFSWKTLHIYFYFNFKGKRLLLVYSGEEQLYPSLHFDGCSQRKIHVFNVTLRNSFDLIKLGHYSAYHIVVMFLVLHLFI